MLQPFKTFFLPPPRKIFSYLSSFLMGRIFRHMRWAKAKISLRYASESVYFAQARRSAQRMFTVFKLFSSCYVLVLLLSHLYWSSVYYFVCILETISMNCNNDNILSWIQVNIIITTPPVVAKQPQDADNGNALKHSTYFVYRQPNFFRP